MSISRYLTAVAVVAVLLSQSGVQGGPNLGQAIAPAPVGPPRVTCRACLLLDDTGGELFARQAGRRLPNASTTKMVTALLVVRSAVTDAVPVSATAAGVGQGGLDLQAGEHYRVEDLLYALLLTSSNDAAVALAEHVAGSEDAFVARMNAFAAELGAADTRFVTSHGLDRPGHYSSARDLARIALAVLRSPALAPIVRTDEIAISGPAGPITLQNRNLLLDRYKGAIGVKTGYTNRAGNVLVAAARREGRRLVAVVMGSDDSFADSADLLDYGFAVLSQGVIIAQDAPVAALVYDPAGSVAAVAAHEVTGLPRPEDVEVLFDPALVGRPVAGEPVGVARVVVRGKTLATVTVLASHTLAPGSEPVAARLLAGMLHAAAGLVGRI